MRIAILSANLGNFDSNPVPPVEQFYHPELETLDITYHRFTDEDFPPIEGLTGRLQYRLPKMFGWEMMPDFDYYIWLDSSMSLQNPNSVKWLREKIAFKDIIFFKHPWRKTILEETTHIEEYLQKGNEYITSRYKNGLHKEFYKKLVENQIEDDLLLASNVFMYRNPEKHHSSNLKEFFKEWWYLQSKYYTCDQIHLPIALKNSGVSLGVIEEDVFKNQYVSLVSKHK